MYIKKVIFLILCGINGIIVSSHVPINPPGGLSFEVKEGQELNQKSRSVNILPPTSLGKLYDLIDSGADVNIIDNEGMTPLMRASILDHVQRIEIVKCLIEKGADPNIKSPPNGNNALLWYIVVMKENWASTFVVAKMLIKAGINLNAQNNKGETALIKAIKLNKNFAFIKLLLDAGARINIQDNDGNTSLMWATWKSNVPVVNALLSLYADVNAKNKNGESFFDFLRVRPQIAKLWEAYSKRYNNLQECQANVRENIIEQNILTCEISNLVSNYFDPASVYNKQLEKAKLENALKIDYAN